MQLHRSTLQRTCAAPPLPASLFPLTHARHARPHPQVGSAEHCLIGTAEIPVAGMHMGEIVPTESLPRKIVAFSHCFRREVRGSNVAGACAKTQGGLTCGSACERIC